MFFSSFLPVLQDKESARQAMLEWIDEDVLPVKYGGKNEIPWERWPLEVELAKYVESLSGHGAPRLPNTEN